MNTATAIADSLVSQLQGGTYTQSPTFSRPVRGTYTLTDTTLEVYIVPGDVDYDLPASTRSETFADISVGIGIYKRIDPQNGTALSGMFDFVQEIIDALTDAPRGLANFDGNGSNAQLVKIVNQPSYEPTVLDQDGVFLSVIAVVYRILR